MKPKTLILMVVAIVCGLGASYMTSRLLAERGDTTDDDKIVVLVAKKNLDIGANIKKPEDMFVPKQFIKGQEPKNAIVKFEDLKDRLIKRPLREGDWVTTGDLLEPGAALGIANNLPVGMRAVGLRVNMEHSASGFTNLPMSRVDIVSTVRRSSDSDSFSQVLLENVLVLAADGDTKRDAEGKAMPAGVVTVALTTEDALKVTMSRELGTLTLLLRKHNDNTRVDFKKVTAKSIYTGDSSRKPGEIEESTQTAAKSAPTPPPQAPTVIPDIPAAPAPKVEPVVVEPTTYTHVITIIEGDQQRKQQYVFDVATRKLSNQDVARTELGNASLQPLPPVVPTPNRQPEAQANPVPQPQPRSENRPQQPDASGS